MNTGPFENEHAAINKQAQVACPYCGSYNSEIFSLFGQQLLTVQYYCHNCRTPFERVKDDAVLYDYITRKEDQQ